jgi:hypothetical protein
MENQNVIDTFIEIEPVSSDDFLKVKETLTRIGIASRKDGDKPVLWQSCHILHKRGRYFIVHFKQMFLLDGKHEKTTVSQEDVNRTKVVASLLQQWGLVSIKSNYDVAVDDNVNLVVIPYQDKSKWSLNSKYSIGRK